MSIVIAIFGAVLAIFSVVIIHEFGHFVVARIVGVRVLRFSIGFGRAIWSRTTKRGTEFAIGWLPLGGYVRMLGEGDEATSKELKQFSYSNKSVYQRMAIIIAGPVMNFIFALVLYWLLFLPGVTHIKPVIGQVKPNSVAAKAGLQPMDQVLAIDNMTVKNWRAVMMAMIARIGDKSTMSLTVQHLPTALIKKVKITADQWQVDQRNPDFLTALGIEPYQPKFPMIVGKVTAGSPAERSGLQQGDRILRVNGKKFDDMLQVVKFIRQHPKKQVNFEIRRDKRLQQITVLVGSERDHHRAVGFLGFRLVQPTWPPSMLQKEKFSLFTAWLPAIEQTWLLIKFNGIVLGKMILGKLSIKSLGGPISIFQMAGKASQQSYRIYLGFLAFLSVTLGFINLLPIPGLDGGHFLFQIIEVIFRKPVPASIQMLSIRIGLILLILLVLSVTINDLSRLFG